MQHSNSNYFFVTGPGSSYLEATYGTHLITFSYLDQAVDAQDAQTEMTLNETLQLLSYQLSAINSGSNVPSSPSTSVSGATTSISAASSSSSHEPVNTSYASQILGDQWVVAYNYSGPVASINTSSKYYQFVSTADFLITNSTYAPYITNISTEVLENIKSNGLVVIKTGLVNSTVASGFLNIEGISFVSGVGNVINLVPFNNTEGIYSTATTPVGTEVAGAFSRGNYFVEVEFSSNSTINLTDAAAKISALGLNAFK